jgi:hypothetical protein
MVLTIWSRRSDACDCRERREFRHGGGGRGGRELRGAGSGDFGSAAAAIAADPSAKPPPSHPSPPPRLVALDYESSAGGRGDFLGRRGRRFHGVNLKAQNETMMTLNYLTTVFVLTLKPKA